MGLTPDGSSKLHDIKDFLADQNVPWVNGYGADRTIRRLGVPGFPTKIIVDRGGRIAWHSQMSGTVEEAIDRALEKS